MPRVQYHYSLKLKIIDEFNSGKSQICLSKKYDIHKSIISRLIKKYRETGIVDSRHLCGRRRKTTRRTDREICSLIKKEPFISSTEILKTLNLNIDASTVRRRAIENGLQSYRPCKKPLLTKKHLQKRQRLW